MIINRLIFTSLTIIKIMECMWKEDVLAQFKELTRRLPRGTHKPGTSSEVKTNHITETTLSVHRTYIGTKFCRQPVLPRTLYLILSYYQFYYHDTEVRFTDIKYIRLLTETFIVVRK